MKEEFFFLKTGRGEFIKVMVDEILYFRADGNYTHIRLKAGNILTICENLKNTVEQFKPGLFVKINRSIVVNQLFVTKLRTGKDPILQLINNETFKPSKKYRDELK